MTRSIIVALLLPVLHACGNDPVPSDCGGMCEPFGGLYPEMGACRNGECTPKLDDCFTRDEFDTCEQACAAQGSTCAENACEGGTSMVTSTLEVCEDRNLEGVIRPHACDAPIDWQVAGTGRCCCEQE